MATQYMFVLSTEREYGRLDVNAAKQKTLAETENENGPKRRDRGEKEKSGETAILLGLRS